MKRNVLNYWIDVLALLAGLLLVATGLLMKYVLLPGSQGGRGHTFWNRSRHEWGDVHFWASVAFVLLIILHVALHWTWVCSTTRALAGRGENGHTTPAWRRTVYGVLFLAAMAGAAAGFVVYASANIAAESGGGQGRRGQHGRGHEPQAETAVGEESTRSEGRHGDGAATTTSVPAEHGPPAARGRSSLRGSTTIDEAAALAGVPAQKLKEALGLPADTPGTARLGQLANEYGLQMSRVREIVNAARPDAP